MTARIDPPAAPPPGPDDERLPCGRLLSETWAAWEEGLPDAHRAACSPCTRAVAELERLETAVRRLHDDPEDPTGDGAASLTDRVMGVVRMELRPGRLLPLGEPDEAMWITESAAARVLRVAAERVPGVRSGSCRIAPEQPPSGRVAVNLHVLAPITSPSLPALADEVRRSVRESADRSLGLEITGIDVHVVGFADASGSADGGSGH